MIYVLYSLFCFFIPNTVWLFANRRKFQGNSPTVRHLVWSYIFMFYCYEAVQDAAGIGTIWDFLAYGKLDETINLVPFSSEGALTYILNIIMFMPLGFLLPLIWDSFRKPRKVILTGFFMSLGIELCQLFCLRVTDVDDLIMNTIGTVAGYLIWLLWKRIFPKAGKDSLELCRNEPILYLTLGMLGIVLLYNWRWLN